MRSHVARRKVTQNKMPVSDDMWKTIAEETYRDETLHQVKTNIINGSIAHYIPYNNFLQELSIVDGVIIKSNSWSQRR